MQREQSSNFRIRERHRAAIAFMTTAIGLLLVLALASDAWARSSGGRYGGSAGFSRSRSGFSGFGSPSPAPTGPYGSPTSPGYSPPMSGPGFGFFPFFLPFFGWGGMGGGFGFGGVLGLLIILGIVALLGKVLLQNLATAWRYRPDRTSSGSLGGERYAVVKCQLALLATARSLQRDLRQYANAAATDTVTGLASALHEVVIALMRHNEYWRYGTVQVQRPATLDDAERTFNQLVSQERANFSEELTVNIDGVRRQAGADERRKSGEVASYLVVTLIVATGYPQFTDYRIPSLKDVETTLQRLGTLLASDILGLEIMWSPENPDDALTEDELIAEYPQLSVL